MSADVEVKAFVINRPRNSADVLRVALKHHYRRPRFRKLVSSGKSGGSRPHNHGFERRRRHRGYKGNRAASRPRPRNFNPYRGMRIPSLIQVPCKTGQNTRLAEENADAWLINGNPISP